MALQRSGFLHHRNRYLDRWRKTGRQPVRIHSSRSLNIFFSSTIQNIMSIVPPIVKTTFTKRIQDLTAQETEAIATNKATAKLIGNQKSEGDRQGIQIDP